MYVHSLYSCMYSLYSCTYIHYTVVCTLIIQLYVRSLYSCMYTHYTVVCTLIIQMYVHSLYSCMYNLYINATCSASSKTVVKPNGWHVENFSNGKNKLISRLISRFFRSAQLGGTQIYTPYVWNDARSDLYTESIA